MHLTRVYRRFFRVLGDRASSQWGRMLGPLLLAALVSLVPLAYSSPPDPDWIAGIYDGADLDEIVDAVVSMAGAVEHTYPLLRKPLVLPAGTVWLAEASLLTTVATAGFPIRAPPLAS